MTNTNPSPASPDIEAMQKKFLETIRGHWLLFFIEGLVLMVLGILAITVAPVASLAITIFMGWLFLIGGGVGFVTTLLGRHLPGFLWSLLSAAIAIIAGAILITRPVSGVVSLTLVLSIFFIFDGIMSIMYGIDHRRNLSNSWGWLVASGIVDLLLAGMIILGLPGTAAWAIGLIVGINFVFGGSSLLAVALRARLFKS